MRYQAVLFDLDGTLLDTLDDLADAGNEALREMGLAEHPSEAYRSFVGSGLATLVERMLPEDRREPELRARAQAAFERIYSQGWHKRTAPYPGIAPLLDQLAAGGLAMAILSNKPDTFTRLCVERLLAPWRFDPVFGQRPGVARKPDPAGALEIAFRLKLDPGAILYVGDSGIDMHTARAAGMDSAGVLWGFRTEAELKEAGAGRLIASPEQLLPILLP